MMDDGDVLSESNQSLKQAEGQLLTRIVDEQASRVGAHMRLLRRALGLTLVQVAALTGLSHSFLSQLERGHARPSMLSLEHIAKALGTSQAELLAAAELRERSPDDKRPDVVRRSEGVRRSFATEARLLSHNSRGFEPVEYIGVNTDLGEYYTHDVDEFVYVISGRVLVDLAGHGKLMLDLGDSVYYYAGTQHRWASLTDEGYGLLLVKQKLDSDREPLGGGSAGGTHGTKVSRNDRS